MRFVEALLGSATPVIAELKRRDADGHDLFAGRTVEQLVAAYAEAGFPCLSVVTGRWFGGTPALLAEVARHTARPILVKDFVVRESQLEWARQHGASAVLLTAALLPATTLRKLVRQALTAGLTPFVEVTSEAEIAALGPAGECVVAVTTKNIRVKERGAPDLDRARRLLPAVLAAGAACPAVASGIESPRTAAEFVTAGYRGVLIGSSLLRSASVTDWSRAFAAFGPEAR